MVDNSNATERPTSTLVVTAFTLALLALVLGFHNVSQRAAADHKLDGLARIHVRANVESRLTALEAERDGLREQLDAITRRLDAIEATDKVADAGAP